MKTLNTKRTLYTVSDFLSWQRSKSLVLSPRFQRRPVWKKGAKSFLMDTIIRGLPIPIIFLREQKSDLKTLEPKREVVDGQQRIRTILSFIDSSLLEDYNEDLEGFTIKSAHNAQLAGKAYNELNKDVRQQILDYEFSVHVLPSHVGDTEVLEIFSRMNATGVKLTEQELRNAGYYGEFKTLIYQLAAEQLERWRKWDIFTDYNIARMDEAELTSDFALLMLKGISSLSQPAMNRLYRDYDETFPEKREIERRFRTIMDTISEKFGETITDTVFSKKTLFYSLFAIVYHHQYGINSKLKKKSPKALSSRTVQKLFSISNAIKNQTAPTKVLAATTRRTTNLNSRFTLFRYLLRMTKNG